MVRWFQCWSGLCHSDNIQQKGCNFLIDWPLDHSKPPAINREILQHSWHVRTEGTHRIWGLSKGVITSESLLQLKKGAPVSFRAWANRVVVYNFHSALAPQVPGQGSRHRWWTQAFVSWHSELRRHLGLQLGGTPKKPGNQVQTGRVPWALHSLFGPHGSGLQGSCGSTVTGSTAKVT